MSGGCGHSESEHQAMREDDAVWESMPLDGIQPRMTPSLPDLVMRRCCGGSTLCRPCRLTDEEREAVRAANAERAARFAAELAATMKAKGIDFGRAA